MAEENSTEKVVVERERGGSGLLFAIIGVVLLLAIIYIVVQYLPFGGDGASDTNINVETPTPTATPE